MSGPRTMLLLIALTGCATTVAPEDARTLEDDARLLDVSGAGDTGASDDALAVPDAPPPPSPCTTPGETRIGACGRCGMRSETCSADRVWEGTSACLGERECFAGTSEERTTADCGEETRLCDATCMWTGWLSSAPPSGECSAGTTRFVRDDTGCGEYRGRHEICSAACSWETRGECTDGCDDTGRGAPTWAAERCIPAGSFVRGRPGTGPASPEAEIMISAFYLDVYTVTARRYQACLAGGGCTSSLVLGDTPLDGPLRNATMRDAQAFCSWDGGRRIATDAELAKAARGPAPRRNLLPWAESLDCDVDVWLIDCGWDAPEAPYHGDDFDDLPQTRSYYGIERLLAGGMEFTSARYSAEYYSTPESRLPDPPGADFGLQEVRGSDPRTLAFNVTDRWWVDGGGRDPVSSFRCARSVDVEVSP